MVVASDGRPCVSRSRKLLPVIPPKRGVPALCRSYAPRINDDAPGGFRSPGRRDLLWARGYYWQFG